MAIVVNAAHNGFLLPDDMWDFPAESDWLADWHGTISAELMLRS